MSDDTSLEPPHIAPTVPLQPPPAIVIDHPAAETEEATAELETRSEPVRPSAWRLLISSGSGRFGLALFAVMLLISAWVLVSYPADFGTARWANPAFWANNPRNAPP